jgi:hypothetical protein
MVLRDYFYSTGTWSSTMPRFFFHVSNGDTIKDEQGDICESVEQAKRQAVTIARELGHANPDTNARKNVCVMDEQGNEVFRTPI